MGRTQSKTEQFADEGVTRDDLNSTTTTKAVVKKLVQGTGASLSSTGVDAGTGDVTISTPPASASAVGHVTTGAQTFAGNKTFNDQVILPEHDNGNSGAGTVTLDFGNGNHQKITQTGNCNYAAPSGLQAGSNYLVRFIGDSTLRAPTFNAVFVFPGGVAPVIAATGSTLIGFYSDGTNLYCTGYILVPGIYFSATDKIAGRATAAAGPGEEITCTAAGRALLDDAAASDQRTTLGLGAMALRPTVATADLDNDAVTYAKAQNVSATDKVLGRLTAGAGDIEEIACTAAGRALLDDADAAAQRVTLGLWHTLSKAADQTMTNSTTLVDDTALTFAMLANTKYRIRGSIFFDTTALGDLKYTFLGPASPTQFRGSRYHIAATGVPVAVTIDLAYPSGSGVALTGTGTTGGYIQFEFIVHNGSNTTPNFKFQFAQNTQQNDSGVVIRAGSYMEWSVA